MEKILLDRDGYQLLLQEREILNQQLKEVFKKKSESVDGANLQDNFDFEEAKREILKIQQQIIRINEKINNVIIVEKGTDDSIIDIGDFVRITRDYGDEKLDDIVNLTATSNIDEHAEYISASINSPIGAAIYKKTVGTTSPFTVENSTYYVTINSKLTKTEIKELVGRKLEKTID